METEWDLSDVNHGKGKFNELRDEYLKSANKFVKKWKNDTSYMKDPRMLKKALIEYESIGKKFVHGGDEMYYYWLLKRKDSNDTKNLQKYKEASVFFENIQNDLQFFTLNISKINKDLQSEFLESKELFLYKNCLKQSFNQSKYVLLEGEEKIMNLKSQGSYQNWVNLTDRLLLSEVREMNINGLEKKMTYPELIGLMRDVDKKLRDESAKLFESILEKHIIVAESEINSVLRDEKINREIRGYSRADEERHVSDNIETETVDALIESVTNNFDISKRYYKLKAKLMGTDKLEYYERSCDYGDINKEYSYQDSIDICTKSFSNLDSEFNNIFQNFIETGKIDAFPKNGKDGGAFCVYFGLMNPTYILLNHTNKLNDVLTMAHEVGHGINNELARKKQNVFNFGTSTATAEVASTFMEDFALEELLKEVDDTEKLSILMNKLDSDISTIQRQVACYNFEKELHEEYDKKNYLPKEDIGGIFKKHMKSYMGDSVNCENANNWWVYWGHIRRPFYVYSYASGLLISKTMQEKTRNDKNFISNVKDFLGAGTSESPKGLFMNMGLDISKTEFWETGLNRISRTLDDTEELAKKLGKI